MSSAVLGIGGSIALGVGAAGVGASLYGANKAAGAQTAAANAADNTQMSMFNTTNANQAPWRQAGGQAVNALSQFYGLGGIAGAAGTPNYNKILSSLPGYQFQMQQGTQAVDRNMAAQGLLQSGAAGKSLQTFGQGLAQNYAQQYTGGLQSLAGLGQSSVQATGALGGQAANQIGSNQIYAGNAQATGYANQAQAINGGINGIVGGLGYMNGYNPYSQATPQMNQGAMNSYNGSQLGGGLMSGGGGYMYNVPGAP